MRAASSRSADDQRRVLALALGHAARLHPVVAPVELRAFGALQDVDYYDPALFNRAYDWMKARGMTEGQSQHAALVVG